MPSAEQLYQAYSDAALKASAKSINGFLDYLIVDSRPPSRYRKLVEKEAWQADLYNLLIPMFESAAGYLDHYDKRAAFIVAAKSHAKTSMLGQLCAWAIAFAKHQVHITAAAADLRQAHLIIERLEAEARQNPWLYKLLTIKSNEAVGPTGKLEVIASDAPSSSGFLSDIIILDELCQWKKRDLFEIVMASRHKRKNTIFIIISNSGVKGSWQHHQFELAGQDTSWIQHTVPAFSASWLNREEIEKDRVLLTPSTFKQMHENLWTEPNEENPFVTREQMIPCINYTQQSKAQPDFKYFCAVDYGIVNDRTAACVCHNESDEIYLDTMQVWQGSPEKRMEITVLENWIEDARQHFGIKKLIADPYQLERTCQHFERTLDVERFNFIAKHQQLAENLRHLIITKKLHLYPNAAQLILKTGVSEDLTEEILNLYIEEKGQRWRFQHADDRHDDRTIVLAMCCLFLVKTNIKPGIWMPPDKAIPPTTDNRQQMLDQANALLAAEPTREMTWD